MYWLEKDKTLECNWQNLKDVHSLNFYLRKYLSILLKFEVGWRDGSVVPRELIPGTYTYSLTPVSGNLLFSSGLLEHQALEHRHTYLQTKHSGVFLAEGVVFVCEVSHCVTQAGLDLWYNMYFYMSVCLSVCRCATCAHTLSWKRTLSVLLPITVYLIPFESGFPIESAA